MSTSQRKARPAIANKCSPAASGSAWRSLALAVEPRVLLLDEPFGALDANVRGELHEWLRRLHDEVHVTTVLVTHDQEEAMSIADNIALMSRGMIEQAGPPRQLYEEPASEFRHGVPRAGDPAWRTPGPPARPHDLAFGGEPADGAIEAMVRRVVHLGFEVRVELALGGDGIISVQVTRQQAEELELQQGDILYVRDASAPPVSA